MSEREVSQWLLTITSIRIRASFIRSRGFKLAITSEIIGKFGGAGVEETPISGTETGAGASTLMTTITVPAGETWLVAVIGTVTAQASGLNGYPYITIGDKQAAFTGEGGVSALVTGAVEIRLRRNYNLGSDSFTGHVYTVKL